MSAFNIGDRVRDEERGQEGTVIGIKLDGRTVAVNWDSCHHEDGGQLTPLGRPVSLQDEVQTLVNILVSTGNDNKRLLSRKVAQLLAGTRGALSRSDKLQAAAMLLVSAGLASDHLAKRDDG